MSDEIKGVAQAESEGLPQGKSSEAGSDRAPSFREEVLPAMEELLETLEKAALSIKNSADAESMILEMKGVSKHVSTLTKSLKSSKTNAPSTPQGKKIKRAFGKVISISAKHEVGEEDAKQVISAVKGYTARITARANEYLNKEKERFTFK